MDAGTLTDSLAETLGLFGGSGEPRTTTEIAEELDLGRRSTYDRLERLVERDRLQTKKVGANARVWWRPGPEGRVTSATDWPRAAESLIDDVLDDVEVGVFVLDDDFEVAWINETVETYFGVDREFALGRDKRDLVTERIAPSVADSERFAETVLATYDDNSYTERFECHVEGGGTEDRWLEHRSKPIECGEYAGGRVELYYDVTERKARERQHADDREEFESLIAAVDEYAIYTLDDEGHVRTWSPGARRIKGYDEDAIVGEHFSTFHTSADRADDVPERNLEAAAREGSIEVEGWRVRADGTRFWANVTISAIRDEDGDVRGFAKVVRDMTERREQEERLRRERRLTEQLLETAPVRLAVFDADGSIERMNSHAREQLDAGLSSPDFFETITSLDEAGNPFPREEHPVWPAFESGESVSGVVVQHETPAGERRWASLTASPLFDADGDLERVVVAGSDITDLKRQEARLERQRDELAEELDDVFARIDDAFFALDTDWQFVHVNDQATEVLGRPAEELIGRSIWEAFPHARGSPFQEEYERAMETQESVAFEEYYPPLSAWFQVNVYPSPEGLSVYFRDVTERKRTEEALRDSERRSRQLFESIDEGLCTVEVLFDDDDEPVDYRFLETNPAFEDQTGLSDAEGERMRQLVSDHEDHWFETYGRVAREREPERFTAKAEALGPRWFDVYAFPVGNPEERQVAILFDDVTQRTERERELERYETIVSSIWDGVYALGPDENFVMANDAYLELTGYEREELLGEPATIVHDETIAEAAAEKAESIRGDQQGAILEFELETRSGETIAVESRFGPYQYDDERYGRCGVVRDISARKEYERYLEESKAQLEAATDAGTVGTFEWHVQEDEMVTGPAFARTFGLDPAVTREGVPLDRYLERIHEDDRDRVARTIERALSTCGDYEAEYRVRDADDELRWVVARGDVRCDGDGEPVTFPGALTDVTARKEAELELERQRERLDALNNLNRVVRGITDAVIDQSTREEIEATVCEHLANSESYSFAWTGEVENTSQSVRVRTQAGVDGYLDGVEITVDPDDPRSEGPTGRALRTGELQVTHDLDTDSRHDPWRERVDEYDFRSSAAIPIVHEGTIYGVLNVYADRPRAFDGEEREVIAQLGEIVGHAIAATERKQALISDELVELEFRIENVFEALDVATGTEGRITIDDAVALGDDEFLVYGTVSDDGVEAVEDVVAAVPHWESIRFHDDGSPVGFEVRMTNPPVLSTVASLGGYVEEAAIENGDYRMTIHLAPSVDVRRVIEAVEGAYPTAEMVRRRQITRSNADRDRGPRELVGDLTDRQRAALEAAFHAGFFEWPRDTSGEDVAESIGVAPPTFHQHLRKAERKVFEAILAPDAEDRADTST